VGEELGASDWHTVDQGRVNAYGLNRVRFPSPVPVGSRVRAVARLKEASPVDGGVQGVLEATVETEGGTKPACVAETVFRLYF